MKGRVDVGGESFLACCACGFRALASSHEQALEALFWHERNVHPGDSNARASLYAYRRRHSAAA